MRRRVNVRVALRTAKAAALRAGIMSKLLIEYGVCNEVVADPRRSNQFTWDRGANIGGLGEIVRRLNGHQVAFVKSEEDIYGFGSHLVRPVAYRTRWSLDPTDNSSERNPFNFTSSIALIDSSGTPMVSCTYNPPLENSNVHELYVAVSGRGAYLQRISLDLKKYQITKLDLSTDEALYRLNKTLDPIFEGLGKQRFWDGQGSPIRVSEVKEVKRARVGVSSRPDPLVGDVLDRLGIADENRVVIRGAVRKGTYVALGKLDAFIETTSQDEPDIAGVVGLVPAAGGEVTNAWNQPLQFIDPHAQYKTGIVMTNGSLHKSFQEALREAMENQG